MISFLTWFIIFFQGSAPQGTVKVKDIYVDKTEVLNIHWLEYVHFRESELPMNELRTLRPDAANTWFSDPTNHYKPIVLITYEQALNYCAWRSRVVSKKFGIEVTYKLPSPQEWKVIAEEIQKTDSKQSSKELSDLQHLVEKDPNQYFLAERRDPKNRVYDFFDNVSEMTSEKGVAMGANNAELTDLPTNLTRTITYSASNKYVGFRCVAEVK